ncbi:unnamed protein product [Somion occarium]|uniref:Uncharacterized protein n=1 Tax=Somion occarium TaxID=3059160 RepID=A0ABP1DDQ6_9APHY
MAHSSHTLHLRGDSRSKNISVSASAQSPLMHATSSGVPPVHSVTILPSMKDISYVSSLGDEEKGPLPASLADKFATSPDPSSWGGNIWMNIREADGHLHNPDPRRDRKNDQGGTILSSRRVANLVYLLFLGLGVATLFAGFLLITYFTKKPISNNGGVNSKGINSTRQIRSMASNWGPIDRHAAGRLHQIRLRYRQKVAAHFQ